MHQDQRGHAMTTENPAAAAALDTAIYNFLHWKSALMPEIKAALEADPGFGLAQAVNGLVLHAARNLAYRPMIGESLAAARAAETAMTSREKLYVAALDAAYRGEIAESVSRYETILAAHPTDLFAQRLAQMELFWIGEMAWSADISSRVEDAWTPTFRATATTSPAAPSTWRRPTITRRPSAWAAGPWSSTRPTSGAPTPSPT